ncbi:MAG: glycosyltransferase family 2 protein [Candidatus Anstonellales archaeon]
MDEITNTSTELHKEKHLKRYDPKTAIIDGATAPKGFERTKLVVPAKRNLLIVGLAIVVAIFILSFIFSIRIVFVIYTIYMIFILCTFFIMWFEEKERNKLQKLRETLEDIKWPDVTIVIPSYNTSHTILKCIQKCKELEYNGKKEIVVVDDGSTDGSQELLKSVDGITLLIKEKNEGKGSALNWAIRRTQGEIIVTIDSDSYPEKDVLIKAIPLFYKDPKVAAVVIFVKPVSEVKNFIQKVQQLDYWMNFGYFFKAIYNIGGLYVTPGPLSMYRRTFFEELGGFDEKNITEDMEIALRLQRHGYKIEYCYDAEVETEVPLTLNGLFKQRLRWYRGGIVNMFNYSDMIFNPKYEALGMFIMPIVITTGLFSSIFLAWNIIYHSRNILQGLIPWLYNFEAMASVGITLKSFDVFAIDSIYIFAGFSTLFWIYFVYMGFKISRTKFTKEYILPTLGMFFLFPIFSAFTFFIAYVYEFLGKEYRWS